MTNNDIPADLPPIQLLITACPATDDPGDRYAWLNGFCLLTIQPRHHTVELTGEVRVGHRHAENAALVRYLAEAIDEEAVLAGYDLHDTISRLGRLPIGADQPTPAIALLSKLKRMLEAHVPLDVGWNDDTRRTVHNLSVEHDLELSGDIAPYCEARVVGDEAIDRSHAREGNDPLAVELADNAGACLLALGETYLPEELGPQIIAAWQRWRRSQVPVFPPSPTLVVSR
ncbi:hypothetical protein GCM10011515_08950 [Tsuneonella deserti]|uniref:Uncharacterized protein n=1 Tax=Tsuneonella deserti TaxID=2035528 RepID=A0ABQ1S6T7_9SPHN|nr:hypothetical protein [Tsuneonella deserti]GGD91491.1 hypothetical protein GCM10011515_08950 [Tsuneonella deserti]